MQILKVIAIFISFLLLLINAYLFINSRIQLKQILDSPLQAKQCVHFSTKQFDGGEDMTKEYWLFSCNLGSEFKSLMLYYSPNDKKVTNYQFFNMNYESLEMSSPYYCDYHIVEEDNKKNLYEQCSVFVGTESFLWFFDKQTSFDTPLTLVTDKKIIDKEFKEMIP